ncbi:protein kinase-like domain-containing protein [Artemisia annua]|uniref:Protein kinase-like domain-containing protein n=1 Tax=Artemisia annua TaxID=35608 RepID=A0A2U1QAN9_ARTAN|nr:protein kinase-like domain-containing protein [Artemisia annua]
MKLLRLDSLHSTAKSGKSLSFQMRLHVALDSAKGILYLHTQANPPVFHRDIKTSNNFIDSKLTAKVADFEVLRVAPLCIHRSEEPVVWTDLVAFLDSGQKLARRGGKVAGWDKIDVADTGEVDVVDVPVDVVDEVDVEKKIEDSMRSPRPTLYEHSQTPVGSISWVPHVDDGIPIPVEGRYYNTIEEAIEMYSTYAEAGGFQIKKSGQRLTKSGKENWFACLDVNRFETKPV